MTLPSFRFIIQTLFVLKQMYTLKTSDGRFPIWTSLSTWIPGILMSLQVFKPWLMPQTMSKFKFITLKNLPTISRKYYANYLIMCCLFFLDCDRQIDGGTKCRHCIICQRIWCALAATSIVQWVNLETNSCSCNQYSTRFRTAKRVRNCSSLKWFWYFYFKLLLNCLHLSESNKFSLSPN